MWNEILENKERDPNLYSSSAMNVFMRRYQHLYDDAECWIEYDGFSVIVQMQDGRAYMYDESEDRLRKIKMFTDSSELTKEEWQKGFAFFLEKAIWESGIPKYIISEDAGISIVHFNNCLHNKTIPSAYVLHRLANAIGCEITDILPHDFVPLN